MNRLFSFIILLRSFHELSHILPLAQRSAQGRTIASPAPALANKIAAARYLQLIPFGYRVGREVTSL
ncbi:hypothetical protein DMI70_18690 [Escherichia coli]|nr:hypothetical protein [Escherichia coli]